MTADVACGVCFCSTLAILVFSEANGVLCVSSSINYAVDRPPE